MSGILTCFCDRLFGAVKLPKFGAELLKFPNLDTNTASNQHYVVKNVEICAMAMMQLFGRRRLLLNVARKHQYRCHHPNPFDPKTTKGWKAAVKVGVRCSIAYHSCL
jgi:hypothetical protein